MDNINVKLLDCTLRDGGYYNDWDFSDELIREYLLAMASIEVSYVEIGFRSLINNKFRGGCAFSTDDYIRSLPVPESLDEKIGVMINGFELISDDENNKIYLEYVLESLFVEKRNSPVTLVRIACHVHELEKCLPASVWLRDKGYKVGFNLMQIGDLHREEIIALARLANDYPIDVLYFADSMGSLSVARTSEIIDAFREAWKGELGIHTHNNMGGALANSVQAIKDGVTWVDSTITGMGRGAGNVQTEYLVIAINKYRSGNVKMTKILEVVEKYFRPLKEACGWGVSAYYYLAGSYGIHPSYVQEMTGDPRYSTEDILAVIEHLRLYGGKKFSQDLLESARHFRNGGPGGRWKPSADIQEREVLILGTGPGLARHRRAIESYISRKRPYVIALNAQRNVSDSLIDVRAACHPVRLLADCHEHLALPQPLIAPFSMLPEDVKLELKNKEVLDFGIEINKTHFEVYDNYCSIPNSLVLSYSLAVATSGKASKILLAGFDGYSADDSRRKEIDYIFKLYMNSPCNVPIVSVTPTRYEVPVVSIYALEK